MHVPPEQAIEQIIAPTVVFVEDQFGVPFLQGLCSQRKLALPQVISTFGKDKKSETYISYLRQTPFEVGLVRGVGFVRDSEFPGYSAAHPDSAFESLCGFFERQGWPRPKDVDEFVQTPLGCKAGIHIVPARRVPGCLETLCMRAVAEDPASECVEEFMECLSRQGIRHEGGQREKARMQAFVASRPKPQTPLRTLFGETKTWWYDSREYDALASFLSKLSQV